MRLVHYRTPSSRSLATDGLFARSPWAGWDGEIDRLFATAFAGPSVFSTAGAPPVDLYQDGNATCVRVELPGVAREAIQVEVVDGQLNLRAERVRGEGEARETVAFSRSITLSDEIDETAIRAQLEHGVLTLTLPRKAEAMPRKVTVPIN
jgi:HSP20 family protein